MLKLTKRMINEQLVPHLSKGKRDPACKVGLWRMVRAILKRLKTGLQWRELPMKELFGRDKISWQTVFYYFSKWSKDGSWYRLWTALLKLYKRLLNMSSVQLDGSQNMLFLTDQQDIPLACSEPVAGNHNDLFKIEQTMSKLTTTLSDSLIAIEGLFMNADAGFDSQKLRTLCEQLEIFPNIDQNKRNTKKPDQYDYLFDPQLYKERFVIERTNAWLDGFKNLFLRYETHDKHWLGLHYLAFAIILLRKLDKANG